MKRSQKDLLKELQEPSRETELLAGIKKSVNPTGKLYGDPKFKAEISLTVTVLYNAIPGGIIGPGGLPAALQIPAPYYLFGLTDFQGGFLKSNTLTPLNVWILTALQIWNLPPAPFVQRGDLLMLCQNNIGGVLYERWLVIHCNNVAYGTFLYSFASDLITLNQISYTIPALNLNQFDFPLVFGHQTLFGKLKSDSIDPRLYITNQTFNQNISNIPIELPIDKSLMLCNYLQFDCQTVNYILQVQNVKPLTHRYN